MDALSSTMGRFIATRPADFIPAVGNVIGFAKYAAIGIAIGLVIDKLACRILCVQPESQAASLIKICAVIAGFTASTIIAGHIAPHIEITSMAIRKIFEMAVLGLTAAYGTYHILTTMQEVKKLPDDERFKAQIKNIAKIACAICTGAISATAAVIGAGAAVGATALIGPIAIVAGTILGAYSDAESSSEYS